MTNHYRISKCNDDDLESIVNFMSQYNKDDQKCLHIESSEQTIRDEITSLDAKISESFVKLVDQNEQMLGVVGWETNLEIKTAWIYGPFYSDLVSESDVEEMLKKLIELNNSINRILTMHEQSAMNSMKPLRHIGFKTSKNSTVLERKMERSEQSSENKELLSTQGIDLDALDLIHRASFGIPYLSAKEMIEKSENENHLLLAKVLDGNLVGYIFAEDYGQEESEVYIHFLATAKENRRGGYAGNLILGIVQWAQNLKRDKVCLTVLKSNENAIKLYEKHGFKVLYHAESLEWLRDEGKKD